MTILTWHINMMRSTTWQKTSQFCRFFLCQCGVFFSKICFKVTFETMTYILKLITITLVIINYEVKYLFRCRDFIFNKILGISIHIFLSVIFSWIRLVKGNKSGSQMAEITQICFSKVQHWLQYFLIFIWCQTNVAHEEKCLFFHIRQTFGMCQNLAVVSFSLLPSLKFYW